MRYPIPEGKRELMFLLMLTLTVVVGRLMSGKLRTRAAPYGIVSLELAGNEAADRKGDRSAACPSS
jgi:hypothetical protein